MATPAMDRAEQTSAASPYITVTFLIRRFDPEVSAEATWQDFLVEIDPKERPRRSAQDQVGAGRLADLPPFLRARHLRVDAMRINGRSRLACKTLINDIKPGKPITVEPIKGLTVLKDLVVDMEPFFQG